MIKQFKIRILITFENKKIIKNKSKLSLNSFLVNFNSKK
ncbi:hypothetical protein QW3_2258 [Clostridioides difficile P74]|nr:hypothetical protein QIG_2204 [Clostridioides difficile DA00065]EQK22437.1 hypothetical protein QUY_2230 [Clostridioides difficile P71]EQK31360.1 hypothetical protein QW3_2258 [Clostridioides difficile P74]